MRTRKEIEDEINTLTRFEGPKEQVLHVLAEIMLDVRDAVCPVKISGPLTAGPIDWGIPDMVEKGEVVMQDGKVIDFISETPKEAMRDRMAKMRAARGKSKEAQNAVI